MDQDVEMDAPEISTLREESTPPPSKASSNPGFRLKLVVKDKTKTIASSSAGRQYGDEDDGDEEDEDQEDQLIDDEDAPISSAALGGQASTSSKRKAAASSTQPKRKSRKSENGKKLSSDGVESRGKLKEKILQQPGAPNLAPTMTTFQANPATEPDEDSGADGQVHINIEEPDPPPSISSPGSGKKKAAAKKAPAKKAKAGPSKLKLLPPMLPPEDSGIASEGMTGTAASSPAAVQIDDSYSPEPEGGSVPIELGSDAPSAPHSVPPAEEPINLEGVPVPVYPLPTKPFPVLPPPKISSGFAPTIPLDKTKAQPRRWRVANREIRGIAGGRWFVRAWVGEKESEFANAMQAQKAAAEGGLGGSGVNGLALPKLAGVSISAPQGTSSGKGSKKKTANSSRSGSSVPEHVNGVGSVSARGPSKMRISQMAPPPSSEAGDIESLGS
ncbi:hypothetical protein Moror_3965 [Moniliophthora roreri MCA 2997]|uniref:Uncharacterized protein n=1 Tax=Moniliophthora roreri (strain MCA 2997) TaxID=1381753 RepID=V2YUD6_MONRO|nr:hypothetical protein Moror_3965 [Moniliophthora roreri MCA 2997]